MQLQAKECQELTATIGSPCICSVAKSCSTFCNPMDCSLLGSSVHGIAQARILEWVAISFSRVFPNPGIKPMSPALADRFFTTEPLEKPSFNYLAQVSSYGLGSFVWEQKMQTWAMVYRQYCFCHILLAKTRLDSRDGGLDLHHLIGEAAKYLWSTIVDTLNLPYFLNCLCFWVCCVMLQDSLVLVRTHVVHFYTCEEGFMWTLAAYCIHPHSSFWGGAYSIST